MFSDGVFWTSEAPLPSDNPWMSATSCPPLCHGMSAVWGTPDIPRRHARHGRHISVYPDDVRLSFQESWKGYGHAGLISVHASPGQLHGAPLINVFHRSVSPFPYSY